MLQTKGKSMGVGYAIATPSPMSASPMAIAESQSPISHPCRPFASVG
ncbi:hypothetical protein [Coleofasciculus chthonoplastes]